jgi:hypothetical protein
VILVLSIVAVATASLHVPRLNKKPMPTREGVAGSSQRVF